MNDEWVIIPVLAILAWMVVAVVRMYFKSKEKRTANRQESSLTTSELKMLIGDAVEDATDPLRRKVERMERRLPEAQKERGLREEDAYDEQIGDEAPTEVQRRR